MHFQLPLAFMYARKKNHKYDGASIVIKYHDSFFIGGGNYALIHTSFIRTEIDEQQSLPFQSQEQRVLIHM